MIDIRNTTRNTVLLGLLCLNLAINYIIFLHLGSIDSEIQALKMYSDCHAATLLHTNRLILGQYSSVVTAMQIEQLIIDRERLIERAKIKEKLSLDSGE